MCPGVTSVTGTGSLKQRLVARGQRGAKAQQGDVVSVSFSSFGAAAFAFAAASSSRGFSPVAEAKSICVYG
jgi:hypothetical protein